MRWFWVALGLLGVVAAGCSESYKSARTTKHDAKTEPAKSAAVGTPMDSAVPASAPAFTVVRTDSGELSAELRGVPREHNTESYDRIEDNPFLLARQNPLSTFSIDVDTASYANVRRFLNQGQWPPKGAVRIEELVNYFSYDYPPPKDSTPFSVHVDVGACPWQPEHRLARIGLKGKVVAEAERPPANLVFLLDVSGSMKAPNKLPLVKSAMQMLVQNLSPRDRVAIAVYASASGLALAPTSCKNKQAILEAIEELEAGGSTAGGEGIQLAYKVAQENLVREQVNRVILCTDGDFNVGISDDDALTRLIEEKARSGVFLTVLGFGMGNLKDSKMEKLADKGNGHYGYIDTIHEARKMLVEELGSTLVTIAKDVKIQVDFNPARVGAYRLIGYENRMLRAEDFKDDRKDAGEIGAGHTVTALYELIPAGKEGGVPAAEPSKYQQPTGPTPQSESDELFTVRLRYKQPDAAESQELTHPVADPGKDVSPSPDLQFAAAVACYGMLLRDSEHKGTATYDTVLELARAGKGEDPSGYRGEFIKLAELAKALRGK